MVEWQPRLDEGVKGYIVSTARKELWRLAAWYDLDDIIQEGYLCYHKCALKYKTPKPGEREAKYCNCDRDMTAAEKRRQFMALFKTAFYRRMSTLITRHRSGTELAVSQLGRDANATDRLWESLLPSQGEEATLRTLLASAPTEIRQLIELLTADGEEALQRKPWSRLERRKLPSGKVRYQRVVGRRRVRETSNEYYCRLIGLDPARLDIVNATRCFFLGGEVGKKDLTELSLSGR